MVVPYQGTAPEEIRYFDELGYWMHVQLPVGVDSDNALVAGFHQIAERKQGLRMARIG
jgi:hypothetical protein